MQTHPESTKTKSKTSVELQSGSNDSRDFLSLIYQRISEKELNNVCRRKSKRGRPEVKISSGQVVSGYIFHKVLGQSGSFPEHFEMLFGIKTSGSNLSERRQVLDSDVFQEVLQRTLRPIPEPPPKAFFKDLLSVAIDGLCFSLPNNEHTAKIPRKKNQHGPVGFPKIQCAALVELTMHNPLAARIGIASEWELALPLLDQLPLKCLLLVDRLYGCGGFMCRAKKVLDEKQGHVIARVKSNLKATVLETFSDGSRRVQVKALNPDDYHQVQDTVELREISATITRRGIKPFKIRIWTTLSCAEATVEEVVRHYLARWEQELFFRELKSQLKVNDLLQSQTPETAHQEIAAMLIGCSVIAHERSKLKAGEEGQHRISFIKTWETLEPLWLTLLLGADILTEKQKQQLCDRFYQLMASRVSAKKRKRSCPRVMRQPAQKWPRKRKQKEYNGDFVIKALKIKE